MVCALMNCPEEQVQKGCDCVSADIIDSIKSSGTTYAMLLLAALIIVIAISVFARQMIRKGKVKNGNLWKIISGIAIFLEIVIIFAIFVVSRKYEFWLSGAVFNVAVSLAGVIILVGLILALNKSNRMRDTAKIMLLIDAPVFLALCCLL